MDKKIHIVFDETCCLSIEQFKNDSGFIVINYQQVFHKGDELEVTIKKVGEKDNG